MAQVRAGGYGGLAPALQGEEGDCPIPAPCIVAKQRQHMLGPPLAATEAAEGIFGLAHSKC